MKTVRIGAGAGYSGDRIDPAVELAKKGFISYLVFECLAERTIAIAQQTRMQDPTRGYDPMLAERMEAVLPICARQGIKIITNMGAANPLAECRQRSRHAQGQCHQRGDFVQMQANRKIRYRHYSPGPEQNSQQCADRRGKGEAQGRCIFGNDRC